MDNQAYNYEIIKKAKELSIYYHYVSPGVPYIPFGWHSEHEIIYCLEGKVDIIFTTGTVHLAAEECYMIDSNVLHATKCSGDSSLIVLAIPDDFISCHLPGSENFYFDLHYGTSSPLYLDAQSELKHIILECKKVIDDREDGYQLLFNSLSLRLLFLLNKYFKIPRPENSRNIISKNQQDIANVIAYVYKNYRRSIPIKEVSALTHYQPQYFCRFFKKNTGKTFLSFCNDVRMYFAHQEIIHSDKSIQKIAEANGFKNYDTFRKLFAARFETTPIKFRKSHQSPPAI